MFQSPLTVVMVAALPTAPQRIPPGSPSTSQQLNLHMNPPTQQVKKRSHLHHAICDGGKFNICSSSNILYWPCLLLFYNQQPQMYIVKAISSLHQQILQLLWSPPSKFVFAVFSLFSFPALFCQFRLGGEMGMSIHTHLHYHCNVFQS